jgi:hypothetical protein
VLVSIDAPYADTTAGDLCFALGLPEQPALHVLDLPPVGLRLRLLGASHQVVLAGRCIETVACLPGRPPSLPASVQDGAYRFAAAVYRLDRAAMSRAVARLRDRLAGDPYALVGVFPGDRDAVTALRARAGAGRTRWRTWHAYPQTGELVATRTEVNG